MLDLFGPQHQSREVDGPLVLIGHVRAVDVAELAVEAEVDDLVLLGGREPGRVLIVVPIDHLEQRRERVAELEAQPAAVTEVVDAGELLAEVTLVHVPRVERVVGRRHPQNLS